MALEPDQTAGAAVDPVTPDAGAKSPDNLHDVVTILVCSTCRREDGEDSTPRPGEQLLAAVLAASRREHSPSLRVASVECLGNCKRRLSAAIVSPCGWSYVFGDLQIEHGADLVTGARLMQETTNGLMAWRGRPPCLKSGMVARLPPANFK